MLGSVTDYLAPAFQGSPVAFSRMPFNQSVQLLRHYLLGIRYL
jgi:hypothetical protein